MATAPILPDRRPATALSIVSRHDVIPVDDHPGYFYVTDATSRAQTYIATSLDCNCADYTTHRRPCQHITPVKREAAALCAYEAEWDRHVAEMQHGATRPVTGRRQRRRRGSGGPRQQVLHNATRARRTTMLPEPPSLTDDHDDAALDAALERQELEEIVRDLLGMLVFTEQDLAIEAAAPIPWKIGLALVSDDDDALRTHVSIIPPHRRSHLIQGTFVMHGIAGVMQDNG